MPSPSVSYRAASGAPCLSIPPEGPAVPRRASVVIACGVATLLAATVSYGSAAAAPPAGRPAAANSVLPVPGVPADVVPATAITDSSAPAPTEAGIADRVGPLLRSPALGGRVGLAVVDATTGQQVYESFGGRAQPPASTLKVLAALAALRALGDQARLPTRIVTGPGRQVVLVGGGDATLARVPVQDDADGQRFRPADVEALVTATVTALRAQGRTTVRLRYDDHMFAGPATAPGWPASYVATGVVSPVSALTLDGGRVSAGALARSSDPARAAAEYVAARLRDSGIRVQGEVRRGRAAGSATVLGEVRSPTLGELVERMLTVSDNDLAEALAHLAGAAAGDGSFAGGAAAMQRVLTDLGVGTQDQVIRDGSGLSLQDSLTPSALAATFAAIAADPAGTAAGPVLSGVPVAGLTGTLANRFVGRADDGRGLVWAKTGTLTGVVTLAGTVRDAGGRVLAFAVMADRVVDKIAAQAQVDRIAAALVG